MVRRYIVTLLHYLPSFGLIRKPSSFRKEGISVMIRVKDEVDYIEPSILSIKDFADEIIIVDNGSTDGTTELIKRLSDKYNKIRCLYHPKASHVEVSNIALRNTHYKWILRWDGDLVSRTSGDVNIISLRERIMNLDKNRYYIIYLPIVNLHGDLFHQPRDIPLNIEGRLHTYSSELKYVQLGRLDEKIVGSSLWSRYGKHYPLYFRLLFFRKIYGFHCNVKPANRMLFRYFRTDWNVLNDHTRFPTLEDYVKYRIKNDWRIDNLEEAVRFYIREVFCKDLVPYDRKKFGDYPQLLKDKLKNPKYKIIYKNGKIIGRNDCIEQSFKD